MPRRWDDSMKRLVRANPQHFVSWLLKGALFQRFLSIELKNWTLEADVLIEVLLDGLELLLHIEFQSKEDGNMAQRVLEYNVLAKREYKKQIISFVIYLQKDKIVAVSPLKWSLPNGQEILTFHFGVVKLWEMSFEDIIQTGQSGLLPLLPLTKDGRQRTVVEEMTERLVNAGQTNLLALGKLFAGLVFKDQADHEWLEKRFAMYQDILEESWVYQEILQKGLEKGAEEERQQRLEGLRQTLLAIVQSRYPQMLDLIKNRISDVTDPEVLQKMLFSIGIASGLEEASQTLTKLPKPKPNKKN